MRTLNFIFFIFIYGLNALVAQHQNVIIGNPLGYAYPTEASVII